MPYAASITPVDNNDNNNTVGRLESFDDDNEPVASHIGNTLLNELKHYRRRLTRQSTFRMSGSSARRNHTIMNISTTTSLRRRSKNNNRGISNSGNINVMKSSSSVRRKSWSEELVDDYDEEDEDDEYDDEYDSEDEPATSITAVATAIIVVRYFEHRLLGVTCGRLTSVYERTARLALHRHLNGTDVPFVERYTFDTVHGCKNLFALGAGDTELILDVARQEEEEEEKTMSSTVVHTSSTQSDIIQHLMRELHFEHMVGSKSERLPRLQNLQADFPTIGDDTATATSSSSDVIMPVYRYPGNYSGTEWPTHAWSKTTLSIKRAVEEALRPLYPQHMNHCVTNLYRNGQDHIDHHFDKDLDLNRSGVIVSVSLGSTRIMEVRDKLYPHDVARVELPPYSMFVLGPFTNARFTHAILPNEREFSFDIEEDEADNNGKVATTFNDDDEDVTCNIERGGRISLTFRDVRTFLDVKTQRLFGQGVKGTSSIAVNNDGTLCEDSLSKALECTRQIEKKERCSATAIALGVGATAGYVSWNKSKEGISAKSDTLSLLRSVSALVISTSALYCYIHYARDSMRRLREEGDARLFFSKASATGNKY